MLTTLNLNDIIILVQCCISFGEDSTCYPCCPNKYLVEFRQSATVAEISLDFGTYFLAFVVLVKINLPTPIKNNQYQFVVQINTVAEISLDCGTYFWPLCCWHVDIDHWHFSNCLYQPGKTKILRTAVGEISASRHHSGQLRGPLKTVGPSQHYHIGGI